eukprot:GHRQ01032631.1.p4 GENE.GHRQ01032631.1~~GHRQ01032631.1.p4  ORF type:complete len:104 (-),score=12.04 GHRQ01032631.1:1-312(-)
MHLQVTSYADGNPDFPGSCGRCYEVKCSPGSVLGWEDKPVNFREAYFPFWWYANVTDQMGRSFPGGQEKCTSQSAAGCDFPCHCLAPGWVFVWGWHSIVGRSM